MGPVQYCAGCMKKNPEWPSCSSCGWDESAEEEQPNHLARHSTLLGKYYIGRVLGQGGFGITYLAFEKTMAIPVAIKEYFPGRECYRKADRRTVLPLSESHRGQFEYGLGSFLDEVRALAKLDGRPNIVSVKACEQANGTAYMVMAYIKGRDLKRHLASEGGHIPHSDAQEILMSVLSALSDVHRIGLVHRDISPDNIMISDEGIVKLIDFGAARYAVGEQSMSLTTILKPGYAPPEQYRTSDRQGPWTDVYAASATYYRCITGSIPPMALDRELKDEMAPPSVFCQNLPSERENALLMALSVRAEDRFQSVEAFQQALIVEPIQPKIPPSLHWAVVLLASVFYCWSVWCGLGDGAGAVGPKGVCPEPGGHVPGILIRMLLNHGMHARERFPVSRLRG
jgi:serine/threonine protein kinase